MASAHPILTCEEALAYEKHLFPTPDIEWEAMSRVGVLLGNAILRDFSELYPFPEQAVVLLLVGKGHNGGDALLAAERIRALFPKVKLYALLAHSLSEMRPHTLKAFERLDPEVLYREQVTDFAFDLCIDGLLGMQFTPPLTEPFKELLQTVNALADVSFRVAVDLPSGLQADSGGVEGEAVEAIGDILLIHYKGL